MLRARCSHLNHVRVFITQAPTIPRTSCSILRSFSSTHVYGSPRNKQKSQPTKAASKDSAPDRPAELPLSADPLSPFFGDSSFHDFDAEQKFSFPRDGTWTTLADRLHTSHDALQKESTIVTSSLSKSQTEAIESKLQKNKGKAETSSKLNLKFEKPKSEKPKSEKPKSEKPKSEKLNSEKPKTDAPKRTRKVAMKHDDPIVAILNPDLVHNEPLEQDAKFDVPRLQHNLDRVLFNPGVHVMRDVRSRVYNFDPDIEKIMPVDTFDYDALGPYITASKDENLRALCGKYKKKYCGSTSSLSAILSHFHYLISAWRELNLSGLSRGIELESTKYTALTRSPAAAFVHYKDDSYAIDADKEHDVENILSTLGKSMEKHLLLPKDEFDKYRRTRSHEISEEQRNAGETYHYSGLGDFLIRSQLDAYDPRLPGSGVFDIKTRAVISIRMDVQGYEKGLGYEINRIKGQWHSFEREYADMIRSAFLKYSLQVRMGRMDGIFVAFHNTQRVFGYQYISLSEMDLALHGTTDTKLGDDEFKVSVQMLNELLEKGTQRWPGRTLRLYVETRDTVIPLMYFFLQPISEEHMTRIQTANESSVAASAAKIVAKIQGLQSTLGESEEDTVELEQTPQGDPSDNAEVSSGPEPEPDEVWSELLSKIEEVVENDTNGPETVRAAVIGALGRQNLLQGKSDSEIERAIDSLTEALLADSNYVGSGVKLAEDGEAESEDGGVAGDTDAASSDASDPIEPGMVESDIPLLQDLGVSSTDDGPKDETPDKSTVEITADPRLKDLILKAMTNADGKSSELREFEKVFAETLAETKTRDSGSDTNATPNQETIFTAGPEQDSTKPEILGMVVTVRNRVDGKYTARPDSARYSRWTVGYSIKELPEEKARRIFKQMKNRRRLNYNVDPEKKDAQWYHMFEGGLRRATAHSRKIREKMEQQDQEKQVFHVAWDEEPRPIKKE